ncbi:MAG: hypothetical protein ACRDUA_26515, partial [Micromonosporaceae bacterium]
AGHLDWGYATTIHKAQGVTATQAFVLVDDALYQEAGYVALSRGSRTNRLYTADSPDVIGDFEQHAPVATRAANRVLHGALARSNRQLAAVDQLPTVPAWHRPLSELTTERDQLRYQLESGPPDVSNSLAHVIQQQRHATANLAAATAELKHAEARLAATGGIRRIVQRDRRHQAKNAHAYAARWVRPAQEKVDIISRRRAELEHKAAQRVAWQTGTAPQQARLHELDDAISQRRLELGVSALMNPSDYLTRQLGAVPADRASRAAWLRAAEAIEAYRDQWNITTTDAALGPQVGDPYQRLRRQDVQRIVNTSRHHLGLEHTTQTRSISHGLGR